MKILRYEERKETNRMLEDKVKRGVLEVRGRSHAAQTQTQTQMQTQSQSSTSALLMDRKEKRQEKATISTGSSERWWVWLSSLQG